MTARFPLGLLCCGTLLETALRCYDLRRRIRGLVGLWVWRVIFKVTPSDTESVLLNFNGRGNGGHPRGLARGSSGNFFGTTEVGGSTSCNLGLGCGVLFELNPNGKETVLHKFGDPFTDGQGPAAGVIRDSAGNLYGTTYGGGDYGCGTVFKYTP